MGVPHGEMINQFDPRAPSVIDRVLYFTVGLVLLYRLRRLLHASFRGKIYVRHNVSGNIRCKLSYRALFFVPSAGQPCKGKN